MESNSSLSEKKPLLSFWQIWNMSFGFLGIQFGFALQNANVSRIFQTLGASVEEIPILWIAAPVTGLLVQPIIGYFSDRTWTKLGRRRPYFLIGAVLASLALILMPNAPALWIAAGTLWLMDASINISMEPFRAFVGDNLPDEQRTIGFATQSFFIGTGAVVASALPYILTNVFNMSNTAPEGIVPDSVKWSFYLGASIFLLAVLWTVWRSFEYSPDELKRYEAAENPSSYTAESAESDPSVALKLRSLAFWIGGLGAAILVIIISFQLEKELNILAALLLLAGMLFLMAFLFLRNHRNNVLTQMMSDLVQMPNTMKQLALVQFFSWFALFSMWIYTTAAVTKHIYGTTDTSSEAYNQGANWVGNCFAAYSLVAALIAFVLPVFAKKYGRKMTHMVALVAGAFGLISIYFVTKPVGLLVSMFGVGIAWASILSMPYAILTGSLPAAKMGYYMGVFNFFIVIPQIVAATILGFLLTAFFQGDPIYAMIIGGVSFLVAAGLTLLVKDR